MNKTLIFGHKNPDTDSIMSSMVMENLEKELGNDVKAVRLGKINKETEYVFNFLGIERPELVEKIEDGQDVILVDHNESTQSVDNLENANVQKIVDHHAINFSTSAPMYYRAEPVGCTSTVLYKMYTENDVEISKEIATMMLSAIISDTLLFNSPTCTEKDKQVAEKLAKIAQVDINKYGLDMLKAGTDLSDFSPEELINIDSKTYSTNGLKYQVAQVNTASIEDVLSSKEKIENAINNFMKANELNLFIFMITDIIENNSQIIVLGKKEIAENAFNVKIENNTAFLPGVVSRKKQVVPKVDNVL